MNQVMINAVELDALISEVKFLREENIKLKAHIVEAHKREKMLEAEVAWAENGYRRKDWTLLSDQEILDALGVLEAEEAVFRIARAIQDKLKEKNT